MCGWGAGIPKWGVSQSDTLKTPFQTLVWLVPGTALWSLSATQHSIVQHRMGAKTLPKTCSHECLPPAEATSRFPLAESQTPCPQQYIHFRYPPPAHFPWDIAGCFCLLLSPASPRAAPPFPHINRWLSASRHWEQHSSWLQWRQNFSQGTCSIMPPQLLKHRFHLADTAGTIICLLSVSKRSYSVSLCHNLLPKDCHI